MIAASPAMVARVAAAQATLDRFKGVPLAFGTRDCVRMVAFHLRRMGVKVHLAKGGSYSSLLGARRALARAGFTTLAEAVDAHDLQRIPPASAIVGDIVEMPSVDPIGALTIAMGNGRVLGYHEASDGAVVLAPLAFVAAWRVPSLGVV